NGSSVEHLHAHLIVGQKKSENTEGLKVKLGYKNKS
ncbi:MAG: diadenosine tetraphosphate (Ap4A) HIT family hydrolase, partial [Acidimicrobiales bacterium]